MRADTGYRFNGLRVDGGATANHFLMQFQSDISGIEVFRPDTMEATAAGAAFLAGLAVGFFGNRDEIIYKIRNGVTFRPKLGPDRREALLEGWRRAVRTCQTF